MYNICMNNNTEVEQDTYTGPQVTTKEEYDQLPDSVKRSYLERSRTARRGKEFPDFADPHVTRRSIRKEQG